MISVRPVSPAREWSWSMNTSAASASSTICSTSAADRAGLMGTSTAPVAEAAKRSSQ